MRSLLKYIAWLQRPACWRLLAMANFNLEEPFATINLNIQVGELGR